MKKPPHQPFTSRRMRNELATITAMIDLYCHEHHQPPGNRCPDCATLLQYAEKRLQHCPFQAEKPTCGNCPIHCYQAHMRRKIHLVMRYAGPRMLYRHPLQALRHLLDSLRKAPVLSRQQRQPAESASTQEKL